MRVSVVIPTRDRPTSLRRCLAALREQGGVTLELVVVDDGSAAAGEVAAVAAGFGAGLVRLGGVGPSAARNAGAAEAGCDVVLLLDDDCVPQPGWARALAAAASAPNRIVGGAVVPPQGASPWLRASERIAMEVEAGGDFFRTLNLACHRELLLRVPFDATFPAAAGEDRDWCARAARTGARFVREPSAVVEHHAGLGGRAFVSRQLRYGAAVHLLRRRGTHVPVSAGALRLGLSHGLREDPPAGVVMAAAFVLTAVGYLEGAVRSRG
jgi:GT2 family glycosyltransferase